MAGPDLCKLVLASGNAGKLRELAVMLEPLGISLYPQSGWDFPEAIEDAASFIENALKKARHAASHTGLAAIADDSGLVVPALGGAPGIYSARFAGSTATDADNNLKLLNEMSAFTGKKREAYFHCAMVLVRDPNDPVPLIASASWWGEVADHPSGSGGFGYDPLFRVPEHGCTSAELPREVKNRISHRGQAARALVRMLGETDGNSN